MIRRSHVYMCRYSFGTAVQVLPIPELMPFRLTRQMAGVLQPHDALALLQAPCTLAMTALRSGKDILEVCNPFSLLCRSSASHFLLLLLAGRLMFSMKLSHPTYLHVGICACSQRRHACSLYGLLSVLQGTHHGNAASPFGSTVLDAVAGQP